MTKEKTKKKSKKKDADPLAGVMSVQAAICILAADIEAHRDTMEQISIEPRRAAYKDDAKKLVKDVDRLMTKPVQGSGPLKDMDVLRLRWELLKVAYELLAICKRHRIGISWQPSVETVL